MIFYDDKGNRKVKLWLMKSGVPMNDIDDLEADFRLHTLRILSEKYKYNKIPIEKFICKILNSGIILGKSKGWEY